jgi:hypothetical protein
MMGINLLKSILSVNLITQTEELKMNTLHLRSGLLSKKTPSFYLSVLSVFLPAMLAVGILSTTRPAEAQSVLIARGGTGRVVKMLPKILNTLTAAFGFGTAALERLPQPTPQVSLTQRQIYLVQAVRYQQYLFYQNSGGYLIPLNYQTLNAVMNNIGAYSDEARFVATAMYYFGSR